MCPAKTFNIFSSKTSCFSCNEENNNKGIKCLGGNNIIIDTNTWMTIIQDTNNNNNNKYEIISSECPNGYCCRNGDGCAYHYQTDNKKNKICGFNRDPNIYLCGKCLSGYSEVFASNDCRKCDTNHWEYLLVPYFYSLLFVLFISYTTPPNDYEVRIEKETDFYIIILKENIRGIILSIFRPITYLFQAITIITSYNGITYGLSIPIALFNLDIGYVYYFSLCF